MLNHSRLVGVFVQRVCGGVNHATRSTGRQRCEGSVEDSVIVSWWDRMLLSGLNLFLKSSIVRGPGI